MFRLEITGNTLQEFYGDAVNALMLLAKGGNNMQAPAPGSFPGAAGTAQTTAVPPVDLSGRSAPNASVDEAPASTDWDVVAGPNPTVAPLPVEKRKPVRPPKPAPVIELTAEPEPEKVLASPDTSIPDFLDRSEPVETKTFKLADVQARVNEVNKAHTARLAAEQVVGKTGDLEPKYAAADVQKLGVAYVLKLFKPFKIARLSELAEEKYAEFHAAAQPYVDGVA